MIDTRGFVKYLTIFIMLASTASCSQAPVKRGTEEGTTKAVFLKTANQKFRQLDQNQDGKLSLKNETQSPQHQQIDVNKDQSVTILEWFEFWDTEFGKIDQNGNYKVDDSEDISLER